MPNGDWIQGRDGWRPALPPDSSTANERFQHVVRELEHRLRQAEARLVDTQMERNAAMQQMERNAAMQPSILESRNVDSLAGLYYVDTDTRNYGKIVRHLSDGVLVRPSTIDGVLLGVPENALNNPDDLFRYRALLPMPIDESWVYYETYQEARIASRCETQEEYDARIAQPTINWPPSGTRFSFTSPWVAADMRTVVMRGGAEMVNELTTQAAPTPEPIVDPGFAEPQEPQP